MFYADTAVNGALSATRCGIDFFGINHVLFGTDCPFDPEGGPLFIDGIIKTIDSLKLENDDRRKLYFENAMRLLRLALPKTSKAERDSSSKPKRRGRPKR